MTSFSDLIATSLDYIFLIKRVNMDISNLGTYMAK